MKLEYSIFYPGGNTTALVNNLIVNPILKKQINNKIMALNPQVEQVGFLSQQTNRLEMAGGEFCGNATRCAAYFYLKGLPGQIKIKGSGVSKKLSAGIDKQNNVWTEIPFLPKPITIKSGYSIINLEGITQVITDQTPGKIKAKKILQKLNLIYTVPAAGVMFISKNRSVIKLNPFIWVRDIQTFFNESACASGSAAVGVYFSNRLDQSINLPVLQPSGEKLQVSVNLLSNKTYQVIISGTIKVIEKQLTLTI